MRRISRRVPPSPKPRQPAGVNSQSAAAGTLLMEKFMDERLWCVWIDGVVQGIYPRAMAWDFAEEARRQYPDAYVVTVRGTVAPQPVPDWVQQSEGT
jgi:hypothetical protein